VLRLVLLDGLDLLGHLKHARDWGVWYGGGRVLFLNNGFICIDKETRDSIMVF
jgi:hypothetical protein